MIVLFHLRLGGFNLFRCAVVAVYVSAILRPLAGTDLLVDLCDLFHQEALAEMHHHGRVNQRLPCELVQVDKVLHIGVLLDCSYTALVGQLFVDED